MKTRFFSLLIVVLSAFSSAQASSNVGNPEFNAAFSEANKLMEEKLMSKLPRGTEVINSESPRNGLEIKFEWE